MSELKPIPVRRPRSRARRAVEGTALAMLLLGGLEVVLLHVAEGAVSPTVKLVARALALGLGFVIAALRSQS